MSLGATSTAHNMTFSNPRTFNNSGNADSKSLNSTLNQTLGGKNAWGSSSIWSGGITSGLTTTAGTRDSSASRDSTSQLLPTPTEEIEGKTGSGSLVDSSVSEDYVNNRSAWGAKRSAGPGRSMSNAKYGENSLPQQQQQRSASNAGFPQTMSSANQNVISFTSRPQTINLNSTATVPRQSFGSGFASGLAGRVSEQPPFNVYTKFDRPIDPMQKKPDSAIGSWAESATTPSPSDERRPQFPIQFSRTASMPTSRDGSLPPSRHGEDVPTFTRPDYSRPSQRATPTSSRAPSLSSTRNGAYNYLNGGGSDQMIPHMGQLSISGDSRPSTSYKSSSSTTNGFSNGLNYSQGRQSVQYPPGSRADEVEEVDRMSMNYLGLDEYPASQPRGPANLSSTPAFAERYLRSGGFSEFRPGQPYLGSAASARSYEQASGARTPPEWQNYATGPLATNRRSPVIQDSQAYMDPRVQQLLAVQMRNPYAAAMYNPYAMPPSIQLNAGPPYMMLPQLNMAAIEAQVAPRDSSVGDGVQSALMYEFKSNTKTKRYELRDIYDHIAEFSGDQHGSRFIQTKLETANSDEKERVFREIQPNAIPLMTDVFGNYVIQKFFEHGDQTHKKILANKMRGQVLQLSLQMYGCRVVQKALDHVLVDQQAQLISELEGHVLKCVKDQNGNHVIQKAIERCPSSNIGFIINAFQGQVQHLSIHPYGCRVIQRCLEKCDLPSKSMIMSELMEGIQTMISDQFGNYVVQHIVAHDDGEPKERVLAIVSRGLEGYSKHKFASNVVEKCLERADDNWRRQVLRTLAYTNSQRRIEGEGALVGMIKDNFGNYVIQKLLDTLCLDDYFFFLDLLQPAMNVAKRTGCGKQVQSIDKKMHRFDTYRHVGPPPVASFNRNAFPMPAPPLPYTSNYNSATNTPPPMAMDTLNLHNAGLPGMNGDTVEGAAASRKGSQQSADTGFSQR